MDRNREKWINLTAGKLALLDRKDRSTLNSTTNTLRDLNKLTDWELAQAQLRAVDIVSDQFVKAIQSGEGPRAPDVLARGLIGTLDIPEKLQILRDFVSRKRG